ncbi:MAG: RagB/SusD family nutrient uptake outer membrane protein [Saprospirales bacterium]|nr:RagB/SusD family nutrient uptake outer membrane protein [Saprospirales bacterium]
MNRFKFLYFSALGVLAIFMFATCTDLEVAEQDSIVLESTGGTPQPGDPAALLASAYKDLSNFCDQDQVYSLTDHTTDEMIPPTRGVDWGDNGVWRTLHTHNWAPTHAYVLGSWNRLNQRVFKCNQILFSNPSAQQAAEAKFLRALYMWNVLDLFGVVPFREADEGVDVDPRVLSSGEAFDFIVKDLEDALPNLPNTGPSATNSGATQAAANAMLARLWLNKAKYKAASPEGPYTFDAADMNKVIGYCDAVTAAGYSLESNYFNNFSTSAATEIIFTTAEGSPQNRWFMTLHYSQDPSGWNGFATLADFYAKFEDGDQRKGNYPTPDGTKFSGIARGFLVGQQYKDDATPVIDSRSQKPLTFTSEVPLAGAATEKGIRVIKYHPANAGQYILLRYADVFLMKAEAVMRGGTDPGGKTAVQLVNELRGVRGASALGALDAAVMLDERGRELYWEGIRRTDQIRFGAFTGTWSDKTNTEAFRVLFPIPQQALDSNPNLTQNAGY